MRAGLVGMLVLLGCAHGPRAALPIPPDLEPEVARIRAATARLVTFERLSATALRYVPAVRQGQDPPVLGMVAARTSWARAGSVAFVVARPPDGIQVLYEARVLDEMKSLAGFRRLDEPRPLVGEEEEVWRARQTVLAEFVDGRCGAELDVLVLPRDAADRSLDVYPMPAPRVRWAREQVMVMRGRHVEQLTRDGTMDLVVTGQQRFRVSADGRKLLSRTRMSGPCQVRSLDHVRGAGEFIDVTDTEVELPNEVQLLISTVLGWNFRIVTRRGVWEIVEGELSFVGTR